MKEVRVFAPATVSNVGPGFDLMGFAIEKPGDILRFRKNGRKEIRIINESNTPLPTDPRKNVSGVAALSFLKKTGSTEGYDIIFEQKINPGSGIGSSAASSTAAVYGLNELAGNPLSKTELIPHALEGEFVASGSLHADNIAPAMLGGIVLIRSYKPLDIIQLPLPDHLWCTLVHPDIEIKTSESRKLIPGTMSVSDALSQAGNLASLIAGLMLPDFALIGRSLEDRIAEPVRKDGIPGYAELKKKLRQDGILGMNISGSGPSLFTLSDSAGAAKIAETIMQTEFSRLRIECKTYISRISPQGTRII